MLFYCHPRATKFQQSFSIRLASNKYTNQIYKQSIPTRLARPIFSSNCSFSNCSKWSRSKIKIWGPIPVWICISKDNCSNTTWLGHLINPKSGHPRNRVSICYDWAARPLKTSTKISFVAFAKKYWMTRGSARIQMTVEDFCARSAASKMAIRAQFATRDSCSIHLES